MASFNSIFDLEPFKTIYFIRSNICAYNFKIPNISRLKVIIFFGHSFRAGRGLSPSHILFCIAKCKIKSRLSNLLSNKINICPGQN